MVNKWFKKRGKKIVKNLKKRYFKGGKVKPKNIKLLQIAKDVATLKEIVNAEKKRIDDNGGDIVAQSGSYASNSGFYVHREVFIMPEGTGHRERNGNSIKCHSYHIDLRLEQQNTDQTLKAKVFLVRIKEPQNIVSNDDLIQKMFIVSPFDTRYDYTSSRNYENMTDFAIVGYKHITLKNDDFPTEVPRRDAQMGGRLTFHQRTLEVAGAVSTYSTNELALVVLVDRGNTTAVPPPCISLQWKGTMYYYDN